MYDLAISADPTKSTYYDDKGMLIYIFLGLALYYMQKFE